MSFDQASTIPVGITTAVYGFALPEPSAPGEKGGAGMTPIWDKEAKDSQNKKPILVIGGSSTVGQFGISSSFWQKGT